MKFKCKCRRALLLLIATVCLLTSCNIAGDPSDTTVGDTTVGDTTAGDDTIGDTTVGDETTAGDDTQDTGTTGSDKIYDGVSINGVRLGDFKVEYEAAFQICGMKFDSWMKSVATYKRTEHKIKLVRDKSLPNFNSTIKFKNGDVIISIGKYVDKIDYAVEKFKELIEMAKSGDIKVNENFSEVNPLNNTYYKLTHDEKLNVVFIGGSVTDGYGSTNQETKSWVAHATNWLKEQFPNADINSYKKSVGGTGSYFGLHRFDYEVAPCKPDLLFIEFAVNDFYKGETYDKVVQQSESIVRKAYELNPNMDIVYVLTTERSLLTNSNSNYTQLRAHKAVAEKYGLLTINLAYHLYEDAIKTNGVKFESYFTDSVHPNDAGYEFYASIVTDYLNGAFNSVEDNGKELKTVDLPKEQLSTQPLLLDAGLIPPSEYDVKSNNGWTYSKTQGSSRYGGSYYATVKGSTITLNFSGSSLGFVYTYGADKGSINVTIDNDKTYTVDAADQSSGLTILPVTRSLSDGQHTVTIELAGDSGKSFGLCAVLVD